jgi:hypothetical protein
MEDSLGFFRNYKALLFDGERALDRFRPDTETGPVDPWVSAVPYNIYEDEWPQIVAAPRYGLFPDSPLEPGRAPCSYRMWDWILSGGISAIRGDELLEPHHSARALKPVRDFIVNTLWMEDIRDAFSHDDYRGLEPYVIDFSAMGRKGQELLEAAHVLAHRRGTGKLADASNRMLLHGRMTEDFVKAAAEVAVSHVWGLPLDVDAVGEDVSMGLGIRVSPCTSLGFDEDAPVLRLPVRKSMRAVVNQVLACVCAVVQIGHDPARVSSPALERDEIKDWWSYQPVKVFLAGWETAAWMAMQELVWPDPVFWRQGRPKCDFGSPVKDLLPMTSFRYYLSLASQHFGKLSWQYMQVDDWMASNMYGHAKSMTPSLPCGYCLCTRNDYAGGISPPQGARPFKAKDVTEPWTLYFRAFRKACRDISRAKKVGYYDMRRYHYDMLVRNRAFAARIKDIRRKHRAKQTRRW